MRPSRIFALCGLGLTLGCGSSSTTVDAAADGPGHAGDATAAPPDGSTDAATAGASHQVIVFVWDGLRPDSVTEKDTPTLAALGAQGVSFGDNHATYPTFTMMNGASFASGHFPDKTGFYGNTLWEKGAKGSNSAGAPVDFQQPVFTEDYAILRSLRAYYQNKLLLVGTLFEAAHKKGLTTAAVGKSGPVFLQDAAEEAGIILDEKLAYPLAFARELQAAGFHVPGTTPIAFPIDGGVPADGGLAPSQISEMANPTGIAGTKKLKDSFASDPPSDDTPLTRQHDANEYMMKVFLDYVLPSKKPDLSLIWLRNPDASEHDYGPGSASYRRALRSQDELLGALLGRLRELGIDKTTDVIVVSDHGHSTVSGPLALFPLRFIVGDIVDPTTGGNTRQPGPVVPGDTLTAHPEVGWSVSGEVRLPDLLARAGKGWKAYDGLGCFYNPTLSGIDATGNRVGPDRTDPALCGGKPFVTPDYKVPADLSDPNSIVVAANGGSDYLYFPSATGEPGTALVKDVVRFLQGRAEVGAIFVHSRFGEVPGTLPLNMVRLESTRSTPDVVLSYSWDADEKVQGVPGVEYSSLFVQASNRGMHGSFSPRDVHNTLLALGPDFKKSFTDALPTGNVDLAPTVARILGLALPDTAGRPLLEALATGGRSASDYTAAPSVLKPTSEATGLTVTLPTGAVDATVDSYSIELAIKTLTVTEGGQPQTYRYFDYAKAVRSKKP
jgi:arylsulfatase A-like enzyme